MQNDLQGINQGRLVEQPVDHWDASGDMLEQQSVAALECNSLLDAIRACRISID